MRFCKTRRNKVIRNQMNSTRVNENPFWLKLLCYLAIAVVLSSYAVGVTQYGSAVPGGLTDARFNNIILEHLYVWSIGEAEALWSPEFFYPTPGTLAFSDNHFGSGPIYVLLRLCGADRELAFTLWFLIGHLSTLLATFYVLRQLNFNTLAAAVGALIFALSSTMLIRTEHAQLVYRFATPLAFLFAWRFLETGRIKHLSLLVIFSSWQFLCSIYLGVFLVFFLAAAFLFVLVMPITRAQVFSLPSRAVRSYTRNDFLWLALSSVFAAATLYMLAYYALTSSYYGFTRDPGIIFAQQPVLGSYLVSDYSDLYRGLGRWVQDDFLRHEKQMFVGGVATLLFVFACFTRPRDQSSSTLFYISVGALGFLVLLTLRWPGGFTLYAPFAYLPGFSSIRAVGRIIEVMLLPIAIVAAFGVQSLLSFSQRVLVHSAIAVVLFSGLWFETINTLVYSTPTSLIDERKSGILALVPSELPDDAILVYREQPDPMPFVKTDIDAMILAQDLRRPVLNGYSGNFSPAYRAMRTCDDIVPSLAGAVWAARLSAEEANALLDRLYLIDFDNCEPPSVGGDVFTHEKPAELVTSERVEPSFAEMVSINITGMEIQDDLIQVRLDLQNDNETSLPGNFLAGKHPYRFSWRFVPVGESLPKHLNWDTRAPLTSSVPAKSEASQEILMAPPEQSGEFVLEISFVQEEVMWFHDHGLEIAKSENAISVSAPGDFSIIEVTSIVK